MSQRPNNFIGRFTQLCDSLPYNDSEIASYLGVSRQTVSAWKTGVRSPKGPTIEHIANTFGVNREWLVGCGTDQDRVNNDLEAPGILRIKTKTVPLYESIACGEPIFASESFSAPVAVEEGVNCDFALRCKGDSMIGIRIYDGDIVFVKQMDSVDDGSVAVCLIDDDATLKRVYHLADGRVELRAENPKFKSIIIGGEEETRTLRILGKAVAFQSIIV